VNPTHPPRPSAASGGAEIETAVVAAADLGTADGSRVRSAWAELGANARYFFQTPEWIERIAPLVGADVVLGALFHDGRPIAASILRRRLRRVAGVAFTVLSEVRLGAAELPLADALIEVPQSGRSRLDDLLDVTAPWDAVFLSRLRVGSPWLELAAGFKHVRDEPDVGVGVLDTSVAIDERHAAMPRNMRDTIRKARRRIDQRGDAEVRVAGGPDVAEAYDGFVTLEAAGWKGVNGTALAQTPWMRDMLRDYLLACDTAQVRALYIDGRLAASQFGVRVAGVLSLMYVTFDEDLGDLSPGNVLMADLVESCCVDPSVERIDCGGWQPWHQRWGMIREPTYSLVAFNRRSPRGMIARMGWPAERLLAARRSRQEPPLARLSSAP
jgi:CelD/BcsL family acetyltransferase involved in cellulose biosynthesis